MKDVNAYEEMIEFAIAREIEAYNFYMALSERTKDPRISRVFEELAGEELEHQAKLELELMKVGRVVTEPKQLIDEHEYILSGDKSQLDMDYKDVLLLAMEKEEAAFRTYVSLIPHADSEESSEVLLAIAQEEVKHKLRFETEYDLLRRALCRDLPPARRAARREALRRAK